MEEKKLTRSEGLGVSGEARVPERKGSTTIQARSQRQGDILHGDAGKGKSCKGDSKKGRSSTGSGTGSKTKGAVSARKVFQLERYPHHAVFLNSKYTTRHGQKR